MNSHDFRDKYRPRRVSEFVGNKRTIEILRNIVISGQVPNGILFNGPPGSGKTSLALVLTKALYCQDFSKDVCGQCKHCLNFENVYSNSSDLWIFHDCTRLNEKNLDETLKGGLFAGGFFRLLRPTPRE